YFPQSFKKVHSLVFNISRGKSCGLEVVVDSWPEFSTVICRPQDYSCEEEVPRVSVFTTDPALLKKLLKETDVINWTERFLFEGYDYDLHQIIAEIAAHRKVPLEMRALCYLMMLEDLNALPTLSAESVDASRISSLDLSHADLINKTWKFGGTVRSLRLVENNIKNYPSCCIMDESGNPISWIMTYKYNAMGMLYTLPEHRGKGFAKLAICELAKTLHRLGYPVYCYIELENMKSYELFKNLGFRDVPNYIASWTLCNGK
uniref:Glycine N-acyltransferase-like protein n=1 Tax=Latimeria chalumnae TaxID=7897 RepID=H3AKR7_LATCH